MAYDLINSWLFLWNEVQSLVSKGQSSPSELSNGGVKRDVENNPKCTRLKRALAPRSFLLGVAGR